MPRSSSALMQTLIRPSSGSDISLNALRNISSPVSAPEDVASNFSTDSASACCIASLLPATNETAERISSADTKPTLSPIAARTASIGSTP